MTLCQKWLEEKFPNQQNELKDRFAKTFQKAVALKYKSAKNKNNLLNTKTNRAFFAQLIFPPEAVPTPPKQPKLDDSGLGDVSGSSWACEPLPDHVPEMAPEPVPDPGPKPQPVPVSAQTQTDTSGTEYFLKLCKDYFKNQGEEAL